MCGVFGVFDREGRHGGRDALAAMGREMRHRGPDDAGFFVDGPVAFGMQRLAIIDVDGGQQPISNEDNSIVAVCNGEIYNFRELRQSLQEKGHQFRSLSDSEVVVHLYEEYGDDFVTKLSGMFGLALWDRRRQRLVVARDRLGIKPMYVTQEGGRFAFASELKSLLTLPWMSRSIDSQAMREYLALGYVPAPRSMIRGVDKLEPATLMIVDSEGCRSQRYWSMPPSIDDSLSEAEWIERTVEALRASIQAQMVSDVPLGAFLSGGIDSSAVVAFMAENSDRPVKTYSIGFDTGAAGSYYNELPFARQIAEKFSTDHREIVVRPNVTELIPELLWHLDEPVADSAFVTTYLVSKFAREDVTVILSGVGGDELFGGYRRYWSENLAGLYNAIPGPIRRSVLQPIGRALPSDRNSALLDRMRLLKGFLAGAEYPADERYEHYIRVFGAAELDKVIGADTAGAPRSQAMLDAFERAHPDDPLRRIIDVDLATQLPDDLLMLTDRMSMATSLECRVPLLDDRLLDLTASMPSRLKIRGMDLKHILKKSLRGILPDEIIDRKKRGFGAPIGGWFKTELSGYLDSVLNERIISARGAFDWAAVDAIKSEHAANRRDGADQLLALVNVELWCQMYLDRQSPEDVAGEFAEARA